MANPLAPSPCHSPLSSCTEFEKYFDNVEIGPAFPSMGGLVLTFPTFELASTLMGAMEQNPAKPSIILLPSIYVS